MILYKLTDFQMPHHPPFCFRVNDWLLKINDIDLTNKDRKQVVKAVLNGGGLINMVVRRRKSLGGRLVTPVHINLTGHKGIELISYLACL